MGIEDVILLPIEGKSQPAVISEHQMADVSALVGKTLKHAFYFEPASQENVDSWLRYLETRRTSVPVNVPVVSGIELVAEERRRQIFEEGFDTRHDAQHTSGELLDAGLGYVRAAINVGHPAMQKPPQEWPWEATMWKPNHQDRVPNLVKAAALFVAEIDRLQRIIPKP
jgi:hypothetical protein